MHPEHDNDLQCSIEASWGLPWQIVTSVVPDQADVHAGWSGTILVTNRIWAIDMNQRTNTASGSYIWLHQYCVAHYLYPTGTVVGNMLKLWDAIPRMLRWLEIITNSSGISSDRDFTVFVNMFSSFTFKAYIYIIFAERIVVIICVGRLIFWHSLLFSLRQARHCNNTASDGKGRYGCWRRGGFIWIHNQGRCADGPGTNTALDGHWNSRQFVHWASNRYIYYATRNFRKSI